MNSNFHIFCPPSLVHARGYCVHLFVSILWITNYCRYSWNLLSHPLDLSSGYCSPSCEYHNRGQELLRACSLCQPQGPKENTKRFIFVCWHKLNIAHMTPMKTAMELNLIPLQSHLLSWKEKKLPRFFKQFPSSPFSCEHHFSTLP